MEPTAKVIADSVNPEGVRITSLEVTLHRFVLAEFNTHRMFSRNSASSRAIPVEKQLDKIEAEHTQPLVWPAEQPGMQGGAELEGQDLLDAHLLWERCEAFVVREVGSYVQAHPDKAFRLHKSVTNRLIEPYMSHTLIVTSTRWGNFWRQRCSPLAQPEMRAAAEAMHDAFKASVPKETPWDGWHLPYVEEADWEWAYDTQHGARDLAKVSAARCCRVSALHHDDLKRDCLRDIDQTYQNLVSARPMHASPLEHPAQATFRPGYATITNFDVSWEQLREQEEYRLGLNSRD